MREGGGGCEGGGKGMWGGCRASESHWEQTYSGVTFRSIMLKFFSIIYQTLVVAVLRHLAFRQQNKPFHFTFYCTQSTICESQIFQVS